MTEENQTTVQQLVKLFPFWKLFVTLGVMLSTTGILSIWGYTLPMVQLILIGCFFLLVQVLTYLLKIRIAAWMQRDTAQFKGSLLRYPWEKPVPFAFRNQAEKLTMSLFFLAFGITLIFLFILRGSPSAARMNLLFLLTIAVVFIAAATFHGGNLRWLEDISDGVLTVVLPALSLKLQGNFNIPSGYFIGTLFPAFFVFLIYRFILSMAAMDARATVQPGAFPQLIQGGFFRVHHVLIAAIFLFIVVANLAGVHWRFLGYQLILIPTFAFQIILVERIMAGSKPNWKLIGILALSNLLLLLYFQIITFWFNAF